MFNKFNLIKDGQCLVFGPNRKFVARFKHGGPITMAKFRKELIASHTPQSYFAEMEKGKAPFDILKEANPSWYDSIMTDFKLKALDNHPFVQMAKKLG